MATQDSSPSLIIGQQWSALADFMSSSTENEEEEGDKDGNKNSSDSMKLSRQDMGLFGFCPSRDEFSLVVCEKCNLLVKPQALKNHIESRHGPTNLSSLGNIPASALNSELGKKLLMPLPSKTSAPPPPPTTKSGNRSTGGIFKPVSSGRPPTKASLKQVPASMKNISAPHVGVSMKISPLKSVKPGNRIAPATTASTAISNPVVKVEKLEKVASVPTSLSETSLEETSGSASDLSSSVVSIVDTSKISTLMNGSIKSAVSLTTPSSVAITTSPSIISTPTLIAVTKSWTDTPLSTRSVTTFVTTTVGTKPLMIAPVMTIGSAGALAARPITSAKSSKAGKDQKERKFLPCKDREYDADKHCGVKVSETGKPCTRSLTCKTHALSLRRAVPGRSKSFDDLLKEHKAAKDALLKAKAESQNSAANANRVSPGAANATLKQQASPGMSSGNIKLSHTSAVTVAMSKATVPSTGIPANTTFAKPRNVFQRFTSSALLPPVITVKEESAVKQETTVRVTSGEPTRSSLDKKPDQSFLSHHPKPMAVCQFGGRLNDRGCFLFCRKMDYVRAAFLSALERQLNPPPHKKLCVESNLPKEVQAVNSSHDPYEFNMVDASGAAFNRNSTLINVAKPTIKPKSNLATSPMAAAANTLTFTSVNLSPISVAASLSLPSSIALTATPLSVSSVTQSGLALNWSVKSRDVVNSRSPSASPLPTISSTQLTNPGKRKRSGSSGGPNGQLVAVASSNGALPVAPSVTFAVSATNLTGAISQQSSLTGILTPSLNSHHHTSNLIAIPNVNLTNTYLGQLNTGTAAAAKLNTTNAATVSGSAHKNNNIFKDINLVLTGIDSSSLVNGQLVNITGAQLAELAANQGSTLFFNKNFTPSSSTTSSTTGTIPGTVKRNRSSASKSQQVVNKSASKIPVLEGFKLIPSSSVITSAGLPANAVLMDSGSLLTSVALASGCNTPTLVAITSTANSAAGNPSQLICVDSSSNQITSSTFVNGLGQTYDKSGNSQRHHTSASKPHHHNQHNKAQQQSISLSNMLQANSSSIAVPLPSGSGAQLCSSQAILKPGGTFNLSKGVSLTFPISVSQASLAALTAASKPPQLQQQQQQHTLLVTTSGGASSDVDATAVRVSAKSDLHLQSQLSSSSAGNLIS